MKRVQASGIAAILVLIALAAAPSHIELTVTPVGTDPVAVSGRVESGRERRVALHAEPTPWTGRVAGRGMAGRFDAPGGRVRVRAVLFRGGLRLSELELVGTRVSLSSGPWSFAGRSHAPAHMDNGDPNGRSERWRSDD